MNFTNKGVKWPVVYQKANYSHNTTLQDVSIYSKFSYPGINLELCCLLSVDNVI